MVGEHEQREAVIAGPVQDGSEGAPVVQPSAHVLHALGWRSRLGVLHHERHGVAEVGGVDEVVMTDGAGGGYVNRPGFPGGS